MIFRVKFMVLLTNELDNLNLNKYLSCNHERLTETTAPRRKLVWSSKQQRIRPQPKPLAFQPLVAKDSIQLWSQATAEESNQFEHSKVVRTKPGPTTWNSNHADQETEFKCTVLSIWNGASKKHAEQQHSPNALDQLVCLLSFRLLRQVPATAVSLAVTKLWRAPPGTERDQ